MSRMEAKPKSRSQRVMPAEEGVWIFILGDMLLFSVLFGVYLYYRSLDPVGFAQSQATLNKGLGAFNTLLLLTSSCLVATGLNAARQKKQATCKRVFRLAIACAVAFATIKFVEWREKFQGGIDLLTNDFFSYYFILTGIHFAHVVIGTCVLLFLLNKAKHAEFEAADIRTFEGGGAYWHLVDLLWVVLFPLLYLTR